MSTFIHFIESRVSLMEETKDRLRELSSEVHFKKGDAILKINGYCKHLYFVDSGLVKLSFNTDDGEFIMRFFQENQLFTELESLTTKEPSKYQIIALEDLTCTFFPFRNFQKLCMDDPQMAQFHSKLLSMAHINMMNRISEMLESDAKSRYRGFLKQHSDIINRITLGDLSKYLGINQVTLSRIRKKN